MQQPTPMFPLMSSLPPTVITTEQIQKYLDENKKLILAILDNQNLGKLAECAQYQTQLQKNLMYLAAIADAQPQPSLTPHPGMQQGGFLIQHPQADAMAQQMSSIPPRALFSIPHQLQGPQIHQHLQPLKPGPINTHEGNPRDKSGGAAGEGRVNSTTHGGGESEGK